MPLLQLTIRQQRDHSTLEDTVAFVRDQAALGAPPQHVSGPMGEPATPAGLEAFGRRLATDEWKGTGLAVTSHPVDASVLHGEDPHLYLPPGTPLAMVEARGTFPTFYLSAHASGTGEAAVLTPTVVRFVVAVSGTTFTMYSERGFAE